MAQQDMEHWERDGEALVRELKFDDFAQSAW
jgi:hypothetical protein